MWTLLDQTLQVADLMRQTNLVQLGGRIQLRFPAIADPNFRFALTHEFLNDVIPATWLNEMIFALLTDKHPLPPILTLHAGTGFITADHLALAHSLCDGFRFLLRRFACSFHNRYRTAWT